MEPEDQASAAELYSTNLQESTDKHVPSRAPPGETSCSCATGKQPEKENIQTTAYPQYPPIPVFLPYPYSGQPYHNTLHGLEDNLRHLLNIEIENFRAILQQTLYEQFSVHSSAQLGNPESATNCQQDTDDIVPSPVPDDVHVVPSCHSSIENQTLNTNGERIWSPPINEMDYSHEVYSQENNSARSSMTSDSGIGSASEPIVCEMDPEQQINLCLIELQKHALVISTALTQKEYSI